MTYVGTNSTQSNIISLLCSPQVSAKFGMQVQCCALRASSVKLHGSLTGRRLVSKLVLVLLQGSPPCQAEL